MRLKCIPVKKFSTARMSYPSVVLCIQNCIYSMMIAIWNWFASASCIPILAKR